MILFSRQSEPFACFRSVFCYTIAEEIAKAKKILSIRILLFRVFAQRLNVQFIGLFGLSIPFERLEPVLMHALTIRKADTEFILRIRIPLIGGFAKPPDRLHLVFSYAFPFFITPA